MSSAAFALPNAMPAAHAQVASHPNLFVSAENSQYNNYFAGPQVVQVVVSDPNISQLNQAYGEPVVTVNGKRLRMAQGTDGNWYGYFADRNQAEIAGKTAPVGAVGLNFGYFCGPTSLVGAVKSGLSYTDTKGFTIARNPFGNTTVVTNENLGTTVTPISPFQIGTVGTLNNVCTIPVTTGAGTTTGVTTENVIRENKTLSTVGSSGNNIGAGFAVSAGYEAIWPVIQLYDFSAIPTPVTVDYAAAGGDQVVNLTFDRIPSNLISVTPDRTAYPENAQVFLTMNDPQLGVDPTEEDSWTWGASAQNNTLFYMAFDRNDNPRADGYSAATAAQAMPSGIGGAALVGAPAMQNLIGNLTSMNFNHNGAFTFNPTAQSVRVVDFQSNGKQTLNGTGTVAAGTYVSNHNRGVPAQSRTESISLGSLPITFIEQGGVSTGVFGNWDGAHISDVITLSPNEETAIGASIRGQSATFGYNELSGSIVGGFAFGSITMTAANGTWASGTRIPVTLTDMNDNKNSKVTEHLNDYASTVDRIAAMKIGTPFTLNSGCPTCFDGAADPTILFKAEPIGGYFTGTGFSSSTGGLSTGLNFAGATGTTDPDNAVDELFSDRVVPTFTQPLTPPALLQIGALGVSNSLAAQPSIVIDTGATMQTLLNTIHSSNNTITGGTVPATARFHGFNFLNYDLRSFTSLNGATGVNPSGVAIYLAYNIAPRSTHTFPTGQTVKTFINPAGAIQFDTKFIHLANSTSMEDFINLNGTTADAAKDGNFVDTAHSIYAGDPASVNRQLSGIPATADIGFMYVFNTTGTILPGTVGAAFTNNLPMVTDIFSVGIIGDGTNNNQRINNAIYRWELEETGDNTGVFTELHSS